MRDFIQVEISEIRARISQTGSNSNVSVTKVRPKGYFDSGLWKCNCEPRLPATKFQTKKAGENQGRWFYKCQKSEPHRCDFFLWDDDAKPRERAAVLANSNTEPMSTFRRTGGPTSIPASGDSVKLRGRPATKREAGGNDDEWDSDDDEALISIADSSQKNASATSSQFGRAPETPRKASKTVANSSPSKRDAYGTQGRTDNHSSDSRFKRPVSPSPAGRNPVPGISPTLRRGQAGLFSPQITPSDAPRYRDAFSTATPSNPLNRSVLYPSHSGPFGLGTPGRTPTKPSPFSNLANEVLHVVLGPESTGALSDGSNAELVAVLQKYTRLAQGIEQGRDLSREALNNCKARVHDLEERILCLELELEMEKRTRAYEVAQLAGTVRPAELAASALPLAESTSTTKPGQGRGISDTAVEAGISRTPAFKSAKSIIESASTPSGHEPAASAERPTREQLSRSTLPRFNEVSGAGVGSGSGSGSQRRSPSAGSSNGSSDDSDGSYDRDMPSEEDEP